MEIEIFNSVSGHRSQLQTALNIALELHCVHLTSGRPANQKLALETLFWRYTVLQIYTLINTV